MVNIKLDEKHFLVTDEYQWTIRKFLREDEKGRVRYKNISHHSSASSALESFHKQCVRHSDATTLHDLLDISEKLRGALLLSAGIALEAESKGVF